ncbi:aldose epimerase family protein [Gimibacter soli]|uniref:Aldose 1-epimerase n=1 Tax=Gimibacter soli TaxID=3024400 RepID=A0AAF0BM24_9PROT|nr:aldose epimerase family protein [Gimibacter soli]WCL53926.1 galactose mutarotase [Gimibacter soli]
MPVETALPGITREPFGTLSDGRPASLYRLSDGGSFTVSITEYGARIVSLTTPDRDGRLADVVLGFDSIADYEADRAYIGCVAGRYANRIGGSCFTIDGTEYRLTANEGPNQLHGGPDGFDKRFWTAEMLEGAALRLTLGSPDGDNGFPGTLNASVTYRITAPGTLTVDYEATTDKATLVNLTQHSYFNLDGHAAGSTLGHDLMIAADRYLPVDGANLPLEPEAVSGTDFDFRETRPVRGHYDHNWIVAERFAPGAVQAVATLSSPRSGRRMTVLTDKPGLQFYTGHHLPGAEGKEGAVYGQCAGLCLETQLFPDSPNHPDWPSAILRPGGKYHSRTVFAFDTIT